MAVFLTLVRYVFSLVTCKIKLHDIYGLFYKTIKVIHVIMYRWEKKGFLGVL